MKRHGCHSTKLQTSKQKSQNMYTDEKKSNQTRGGLCYKVLASSLEEEIDCMFLDGEVRLFSPHSGIDLDHPFLKLLSDVPLSNFSLFLAKLNLPRFQKGIKKLVTPNSPNQIKSTSTMFSSSSKSSSIHGKTSPQPNPGRSHEALQLSGLTVMCISQRGGLRGAESDAVAPPHAVAAVPEGKNTPKAPVYSKIKA